MNGELPEHSSLTPEAGQPLHPLSGHQDYPEVFVFRRSELEALDFDARSASVLSQLCDVLMLIEKACARSLTPSTEPITRCSVFILEIFLRMLEAERPAHLQSTPNDF
jgi:hypothetical protein